MFPIGMPDKMYIEFSRTVRSNRQLEEYSNKLNRAPVDKLIWWMTKNAQMHYKCAGEFGTISMDGRDREFLLAQLVEKYKPTKVENFFL
jgi:hypothetical protein